MTTLAGVYIALGLVIAAWVGRASQPAPTANAAGWVFAILGTIVLLLAVFGIVVVR